MAFNIWERWPWTSFQNLNLDWLMKAVKEAVTKAEEASASVGQFDARITANTEAIEQLGDDMETISSPVRVLVNAELQARYRGNLVTGSQLLAMMQTHGDLPYVEYNGETYMLDTPGSTGDLRFSMAHTTLLGDVTLRHITIFAQSSDAAYSVTNVGGGGSGSSDVMVVTITDSGSGYTMDSSYAAIVSQLDAGKAVIVRVQSTGSTGAYAVSGMIMKETATVEGQTMGVLRIIDPNMIHPAGAFNMYAWYIYENNTVGRGLIHENIATLAAVSAWVNDGDTNALLKTAQTLTPEEQAQVKQNLNITEGGGGSAAGAVRYDVVQTLTSQQKAQARDNIGADSRPLVLNVTESNGMFSVDKTAAEIRENLHNLALTFGLNEGVYIDSYKIYGSPPYTSCVFTVTDPESSSVSYIEYIVDVYMAGEAPSEAADVPSVTRHMYTHNIGGGSLPVTTNASAGDFLRLDANKNVVWQAVPAAESNSFGGV